MDTEQNAASPTISQQTQADREFDLQLVARLRPYLNRVQENTRRATTLLDLFEHASDIEAEGCEDLLRAAVVFIHAYLEDLSCAPSQVSCSRLATRAALRNTTCRRRKFGRG